MGGRLCIKSPLKMCDLLNLREVLLVEVLVLPFDGGDTILKSSHCGKEVRRLLCRDGRWVIFHFIVVILVVVLCRRLNIGRGRLLLVGHVDWGIFPEKSVLTGVVTLLRTQLP